MREIFGTEEGSKLAEAALARLEGRAPHPPFWIHLESELQKGTGFTFRGRFLGYDVMKFTQDKIGIGTGGEPRQYVTTQVAWSFLGLKTYVSLPISQRRTVAHELLHLGNIRREDDPQLLVRENAIMRAFGEVDRLR